MHFFKRMKVFLSDSPCFKTYFSYFTSSSTIAPCPVTRAQSWRIFETLKFCNFGIYEPIDFKLCFRVIEKVSHPYMVVRNLYVNIFWKKFVRMFPGSNLPCTHIWNPISLEFMNRLTWNFLWGCLRRSPIRTKC